MTNKQMGLLARGNEFNSVIENTSFTDKNGNKFDIKEGCRKFIYQLLMARKQQDSIYIIGNGGSAGVASHALTDFLNVCRLRAFTLHDCSLITCMANDFGYENAFVQILDRVMRPNDILIAISSSGKSLNICNAAKAATEKGGIVVSLSGFSPNNPLRKLGDLNFWLDSSDYCMVEIGHQFILHNISDQIGYLSKMNQTHLITEEALT